MHGRFAIANDDFLYVLSTFVFEPIRWNTRFGWRPMVGPERLGYFHFWREVGRRMNIKDIPSDYDSFEPSTATTSARHFRYTEANHRVGVATRELFASLVPAAAGAARPVGRLRDARRPAAGGLRLPPPVAADADPRPVVPPPPRPTPPPLAPPPTPPAPD